MPNNGRVTLCPYYRDEKNLSISCEDTFHRFRWAAQKRRHMDTFCDKDWKSCPYAQEIGAMYEKGDYMDEVKRAAFELEATKKELRKTATMLGKAQKREKEKDEKIRDLQNSNRALMDIHMREKKRLKELTEKEDAVLKDFEAMAAHYEARFAYLLDMFGGGYLNEIDFLEWAKAHEFAVVADKQVEFEGRKITAGWKVKVRDIREEADDEHGAERPAGENEEAGGGENSRTDEGKKLN